MTEVLGGPRGTTTVRPLTADELPALRALTDEDPLVNLFVRARLDSSGLDARWLAAQVLGCFDAGRLVAACHVGANVVPIQAGPAAIEGFAEHLSTQRRPSSIVGPRDAVLALWERLEPVWGAARSPRPDQPFLVLRDDGAVAPDPRVRPIMLDEVDVLYPASVAMFTEEVGVDPEVTGGHGYRARVTQLVAQGWAFGIVEQGSVVFKAEVGAVTDAGCQVQGVYVRPDLRGQGIAAAAMAGVVQQVRRSIAPVVTLYVNDHNTAARRTYERVGFEQEATFASILM